LNTLVNFRPAQPSKTGQFSTGVNTLLAKGLDKPVIDATHNADLTTAFGRMFARMMAQADLLIDKHTGKKRTLYSLRHFYATHYF
jgi:hypothetical protein